MTTFADYAAARQYLEPFVQSSTFGALPHLALQRTKALMTLLGNPQDAVPVIHLAGTSGKGSTATILAALLKAHGLRVGLGLSPHVRHLLERVQIDGAPVTETEFCRVLGEMVPAISAMQGNAQPLMAEQATVQPSMADSVMDSEAEQFNRWGAPSFFEILIALSYKLFAQRGVDVVVMETGLGGRYDATNTVTSEEKIALFTDISYDHVEILGNTLPKIAAQKAGIIQRHNRVLTYLQPPDAQEVIAAECEAQEAHLTIFDPTTALHAIELHPTHLLFDLTLPALPPLRALHLSLAGAHQAQNAGLAIAAAQLFLNGIGRTLDEAAIRHALAHITLPGRMEQRFWRGAQIIIDGAHNPQKIHALCSALVALYPDQRFVFVVALKEGKDYNAIFAQLLPLAAQIILTRFENTDQGMPLKAVEPEELGAHLPTENDVPVRVVPNVADALALAIHMAQAADKTLPIVVTGSLYLLAEVYAVIEGRAETPPAPRSQ